MTPAYSLRPRADRDIDEYVDYLAANVGLRVALHFLDATHQTLALLASQPNVGWRSRLMRPELASMRVFRVAGFERMLILYRPVEDGIEVLRIMHGSRNLQVLLRRREELE